MLVSFCFEQGVTVAPKGIAGYVETRMEARFRKNVGMRWKGTITSCYFPYFGIVTDWGSIGSEGASI